MGPSHLSSVGRFAMLLGLAATVAGCASSGFPTDDPNKPPYLIPGSAVRVAEGPPPLSYIPTGESTVFILDNSAGALITTNDVQANNTGSFYVVDPTEKAVVVKNAKDPSQRIVLAAPIDPSHRFSIWVVKSNANTTTQP